MKMGLHNFAPAAARPNTNFKFSKFLLVSFSMSVCTKLAIDEDWSSPPLNSFLVWFGLVGVVWFGLFNRFFHP